MTPIEIIALIFALAVLIKLIVVIFSPKKWMKFAESWLKMGTGLMIIYLIAAIVIGYFLLQSLTIVQIAAAMLFTAMLMGVGVMMYPGPVLKLGKEILNKKNVVKKNWLSLLIWIILAIWVLYALFP